MPSDHVPTITRVYMAAFVILLACIALLSCSIAYTSLVLSREVSSVKLILLNDYEITQ